MTAKSKSRTSKSKANKKVSAPRWVIAVVLFIVVATGAFLVYQSFASGGPSGIRTIYCGSGRCSDVRIEPNWQPKSAYTRYNSRCNFGQTEYREVGSPKSSWNCLWIYV